MSEAPGTALGPETTLESGIDPAQATDRREGLAAALGALEDAEPATAAIVPAEGEAPAAAASEPAAAPVEPEPWTTPPTSWKKDYHDAFTKADPTLRQYISEREEEMRKGVEPLIPKAKFADEFQTVIQPFQQNIQAAGVPPLAAVQTLMNADNILRNAPMDQKIAYIQQLLPQYGIDLSGIDWSQNAVDPRLMAMQKEIDNLRNQVTPIQQQHVDSQNRALLSDIETFAKDKPHFEAVRPAMATLLQSGQASDLQDAYDQAMKPWASTLTDAEAGRQAAAKAAERKAADEAAKAARAAAVSTRTSTPGGSPATKAQDRRALIEAGLDGISARL